MWTEEELEDSLSHIDVTDRIDVYETGKTFNCNCGQGIGIEHYVSAVKCAKCGRVCVDRKADSREPNKREEDGGNDGLGIKLDDFM